jgi:hypothetical protein
VVDEKTTAPLVRATPNAFQELRSEESYCGARDSAQQRRKVIGGRSASRDDQSSCDVEFLMCRASTSCTRDHIDGHWIEGRQVRQEYAKRITKFLGLT